MKIAQAYLEENNTLNLSEINLAHSLPFIITHVLCVLDICLHFDIFTENLPPSCPFAIFATIIPI